MILRFFPHEFSFFDLLEQQVAQAIEAATLFKEVMAKGTIDAASLNRMQEIEHRGDDAAHQVIDRLNRTFITPFDREDIFALAKEMDDIIDIIHTVVGRIRVYRLSGVDKNLVQFAGLIGESVQALARAVRGLRNMKDAKSVHEACVEAHRLENVGDQLRDTVLAELFETEKDPILVIKKKEIYEDAETALDICEDVANVIESILVKQA